MTRTRAEARGVAEPTSRQMVRVAGDDLYLVAFLDQGAKAHRLASGATVTVGRGPQCTIQVELPALSRAHFSVRAGDPPAIRDLGSVNGTRLGGVKLAPDVDTPLPVGTVIEAGGTFFVLHDHHPGGELEHESPPDSSTANAVRAIVVDDPAMARLHQLVGLVARSSMSVLVVGETGVGKEVVANALHARSARAANPMVQVNCAALPESLLESELFGFERGAFTGALQGKPGLIESADRSTFLLDEIGEMPLTIQAKLLRVLESGEITRLGALKPRAVDVRFVAATNRDLPTLVRERRFRADLYYRLNGITIPIPPLRERVVEIRRLAELFLVRGAKKAKRKAPRLSETALARLERHLWPGNVRELRNVVERALTLCTRDVIEADAILLDPVEPAEPPYERAEPPAGGPMRPAPRGRLVRLDREAECAMIQKALDDAGGHQGRAAELLGVSRRTLINRLEEYGLSRPRKR